MCKSEKTANARSPQRPPFLAAESKRMYLVTDDGFARSLTANLVVMAAIMILCTIHPPAHNVALDLYGNINEYFMGIANEMAWWSLLGLLSSSCCAIQILLNALSFGCAGFNTILGPVRPTFVGFTIVAQFSLWYAVYYYHSLGQYTNWKMTVASTALSGVLTLLPELLAWQTKTRQKQKERILLQQQMLMESSHTDKAYEETIHLTFQLSTMGCSSCVSTVSKVLDNIDGVLRHTVSLEDGIAEAEVVLSSKYADTNTLHNNSINNKAEDHDLLWKDIANRLEASGFPAERSLLPETKKKVQ